MTITQVYSELRNSSLLLLAIATLGLFTASTPGTIVESIPITTLAEVQEDNSKEILAYFEGEGDDVTGIPTGELGVTQAAVEATGLSEDTPATLVSESYLALLESKWEAVEGFSVAPDALKSAILDLSYNVGEQALRFNGLKSCLRERNYGCAALELLDTANVGGKSLKGLAKRRAMMYNLYAEKDIDEVVQTEEGTIKYISGGEVLLEYTARGGKHEKSIAGSMPITNSWV